MPIVADAPGTGGAFTRADLDRMPADGRRYELVDGTLIVSAAPGRLHQRACFRLAMLLDDACPDGFEVLPAPFAVALADDTELQPDIVVGRETDFTDRGLFGPPVLAVEILSPSTRLIDTHVKRERLERAGAAAYWVVDPVARPAEARLIAWELGPDKRFRQVADVVGDEAFTAAVPFIVTVTPSTLVGLG